MVWHETVVWGLDGNGPVHPGYRGVLRPVIRPGDFQFERAHGASSSLDW